jgi:hypothetical protein
MKDLGFCDNSSDRIVELEEIESSLCPICKEPTYKFHICDGKKKETLECKIRKELNSEYNVLNASICHPYVIAQIAKKHFQEHPEELIDEVEGHPEIKEFVVNTLKSFRKLG